MRPDRDTVMAYVDGELDAPARTAFEAAMADDAVLRATVQREAALRRLLAAAYDPVLDEPMPAVLLAAAAAAPQPASPAPAPVHDLEAARAARAAQAAQAQKVAQAARPPTAARLRRSWPEWGALAACLVVGLVLGVVMNLAQTVDTRSGRLALAPGADGTLRAQGALDDRLTRALAADTDTSTTPEVSVGLSFVAQDGRYCRSFALAGAAPTAGLACRDAEGWAVRALLPAPPGAPASSTAGFRMAATPLPPALLQLVDSLRAADTLDAAAERAARDRGWRR